MLNQKARNETIKYHEEYYGKHALFEKGCWLEKPDQLSMDLAAKLCSQTSKEREINILDLGCGVGRNTIPLATELKSKNAQILGVDFLQTAVDKLLANASTYGVDNNVSGIRSDMESFDIKKWHYDLILAVSVLEHCSSYEGILKVIDRMISGTKNGGYNRLEFTTNRNVRDKNTNEAIPTFVETPLESDTLTEMLKEKYREWRIDYLELTPYEETLFRDGREILWCSAQLNFVAQH